MAVKLTEELRNAVQHCIWFEPPEQAISNLLRLTAYILTYGTPEDTFALMDQLDNKALSECLDKAPAGIYDSLSWAYWNLMAGRYNTPPTPQKRHWLIGVNIVSDKMDGSPCNRRCNTPEY